MHGKKTRMVETKMNERLKKEPEDYNVKVCERKSDGS